MATEPATSFCQETQLPGAIEVVFVWIGVFQSGAEKILATDIPMPHTDDQTRHLPLIHTKLDAARRMRTLANSIRRRSQKEHDPLVRVELRRYRRETEHQ